MADAEHLLHKLAQDYFMHNPAIAVIGGSGIEGLLKETAIDTDIHACYRSHSKQIEKFFSGKEIRVDGTHVLFVNRYGIGSSGKAKYKPHEVDYKTMMVGLFQSGVKKVISASKCSSFQDEWPPGTIAILRDCIDMVHRDITLDDIGSDVADMTTPFDPKLCAAIKATAKKEKSKLAEDAVYVLSVDNSRLETPSEISLIRNMFSGKLLSGQIVPTEAQLAKLLNIKYAALPVVTNYAAGMRGEVTKAMIEGAFQKALPKLFRLISSVVTNL